MTENDLINAVIDDGEAEVREAYQRPEEREKRDGALAGFSFCRNRSEAQMKAEIVRSNGISDDLRRKSVVDNYWYWRYYTLQIEFVLNVLNGARHLTGQPHETCTYRGVIKASEIIGGGVLEIQAT